MPTGRILGALLAVLPALSLADVSVPDTTAGHARGEYRSMLYGIDLARALTKDLREVSHDKHAEVRCSFFVRPAELSMKRAEAESRRLVAINCGFELKNLQRATLIGESTGGGAHPIEFKRIDDHFSVVVPIARSVSPITKTNWEGTAVAPDVKVEAAQALDVALKLAAEEISKNRSEQD